MIGTKPNTGNLERRSLGKKKKTTALKKSIDKVSK